MIKEKQILAIAGLVGIRAPIYSYRFKRKTKGVDEQWIDVSCSSDPIKAKQLHKYMSQDWDVTELERYEKWDIYPDYLKDLNAIQAAIIEQSENDQTAILMEICGICASLRIYPILAPAWVRAKALLVITNLWEEKI